MDRVLLKIKRQDDPEDLPYWELFEVPLEPGMTLIDALNFIRENPVTADGIGTTPVAWDCSCLEGTCGACTVLAQGKARPACSVFLEEFDGPLVIEPLSKFPIVRDLKVDRARMLEALKRNECWIELSGQPADGEFKRISSRQKSGLGVFMDCNLCGACSEACPQVNARSQFAGAFIFSHALMLNRHEIGRLGRGKRLASLAQRGGIADCAGAENCERVCPRGIPLVKAAAMLNWETAAYSIKKFLWDWQ